MLGLAICIAAVLAGCLGAGAIFRLGWPSSMLNARPVGLAAIAVVGVVAPGAAAVAIFSGRLASDTDLHLLWTCLLVGSVGSFVLLYLWTKGDRARGRRRCPRCWYAMTGVPGTVCPECGRDAHSERRLFRPQRRRRLLAVLLVPLLAGALVWSAGFFRRGDWPQRIPTTIIAIAYPVIDPGSHLREELDDRIWGRMPEDWPEGWRRGYLVFAASRMQHWVDSPVRALDAGWMLVSLDESDALAVDPMIKLSTSQDPDVARAATELLGCVTANAPAAKARLIEIANSPDVEFTYEALSPLASILERCPGGQAPEVVYTVAGAPNHGWLHGAAVQALGGFDPDDRSRGLLLKVARSGGWRENALSSLLAHWATDPEIQRTFIEYIRTASYSDVCGLFRVLEYDDERLRNGAASLPASRIAAYSPGVIAEIERRLNEMEEVEKTAAAAWPDRPWNNADTMQAIRRSIDQAKRAHAQP